MPDGQVLEFDRVTKRFSDVTAVSDFSGRVEPGVVTGFLGPNGAGKTTTLRMLLGQIRPSSGTATIGGAQYADLKHPARVIGAMHEDPGFRPRRSVERHLVLAAKANGIAASRVAEVISFVGLDGEAGTRIGALSLGMRQRLSAATALLGDPGALVLDEPANGLDPEGIRWMRMLIRGLADEGRTVLVSSHVLSEVEQVADEILVIAHGQRKFAGSLASLADPTSGPVVVDAADRAGLTAALTAAGFEFEVLRSGLTVRGSDARTIGAVAAEAGVALSTLQQRGPTLEDVFLDLVNDRPVQLRQPEAPAALAAVPAGADAADEAPVADAAETDAGDVTDDAVDAGTEEVVASEAVAENEADAENAATPDIEATADAGAAVEPETVAEGDEAIDGDAAAIATGADVDTDTDTDEDSAAGSEAPMTSASIDAAPMSATETTVAIPIITAHDSTADGDEDDITADEIPSFVPVSAGEDRPLPGTSGLAAAAAGLSQTGDTTPSPAISSVWASIIARRPLDGSADDAQPESDTPAEASADETPADGSSADVTVAEHTPSDEHVSGDSPAHASVADGEPADETPTDEHADEASNDAPAAGQEPADDASAEDSPAEDALAEESPADESEHAEHIPEDAPSSEESDDEASDVISSVPEGESAPESEGEHQEHPRY